MNTVERVLADDMARLVDRLATSIPEGAMVPRLRIRLDQMEAELAAARASLVDGYARWLRALDDLENLWALAAFRSSAEEPEPKASRRLAA